jgi:hypothetical protein
MGGQDLVEGVVVPSQLSRLDASRWQPRIIPILFGGILIWVGAVALGPPQTRIAVAPFIIPALVLLEMVLVYMLWAWPFRGEGGDIVLTRLGIVRRRPNVALFIPWELAEQPREGHWPTGDYLRFRNSPQAKWAAGRIQLTRSQAKAVQWSSLNPKRSGAQTRGGPLMATGPSLEIGAIPTTISWPAQPGAPIRVRTFAREPGATQFLRFSLTVMVGVVAILSLQTGYLFGTLLISAAFFLPVLPGILVGRRVARADLRSWHVLALLPILWLSPFVTWTASVVLLGWEAFGYPWVYALLPVITASMGIGLGFAFTIFATRPELVSEVGTGHSRVPAPSS